MNPSGTAPSSIADPSNTGANLQSAELHMTIAKRALIGYRYISWLLTSVFYVVGSSGPTLGYKLGVITALLVAGSVASSLYDEERGSRRYTIGVLVAEFMGLAIILVPTGGLDSPFLWYALNPIFAGMSTVPAPYCWLGLGLFLFAASGGDLLLSPLKSARTIWSDKYWLVLFFSMLTAAVQVFTSLVKQLAHTHTELERTNGALQRLVRHTASLYQSLETVSAGDDLERLVELLSTYAMKLTEGRAGVCCLYSPDGSLHTASADPQMLLPAEWRFVLKSTTDDLRSAGESARDHGLQRVIDTLGIVYLPIATDDKFYGIIGHIPAHPRDMDCDDQAPGLRFLADLGTATIERCVVEQLTQQLRIVEEQNRIANEIHDGVSQRLFSVVYALHGLAQKQGGLQDSEIHHQLVLLEQTANQAIKDLRTSIYRISPSKRGDEVFISGVRTYLSDFSSLNDVKIDFTVAGSEDSLSPALRQALYRIVRESTSNAARHGRCSRIRVCLDLNPAKVALEVQDDGTGFTPELVEGNGLGLANMKSLMRTFNGSTTVRSSPGNGTTIRCVVPAESLDQLVEASYAYCGY